jgi:putative ABC transport system substrate-binding protein
MAIYIRRREFIATLGSTAAWPLAARAQQAEPMRRIGVLGIANDVESRSWVDVAVARLRELGWMDGQNIRIDYRFGTVGQGSNMSLLARELVELQPEVIIGGATVATIPLTQHTRSIPIVFAQVADPVGLGIVESLARPGGNVTGFTIFEFSFAAKWLEVLKDTAPAVTRVAILLDPKVPSHPRYLQVIETTASSLGVQSTHVEVSSSVDIGQAFDAFAARSADGLIVLPSPVTLVNREVIIARTAKQRMPAVYPYRYFVTSGGLICYSADLADLYRRAAEYVDRILRGEKPRDLPVQQPTKFQLVINLKTATALGLTVPPMLLARADEVIE